MEAVSTSRYKLIGRPHPDAIPQLKKLSDDQRIVLRAVAAVLPFRVNRYVVDELIDWDDVPADPIFQLTFPQAGMLKRPDLEQMTDLIRGNADKEEVAASARKIRMRMNPNPADQKELNVPSLDGRRLPGVQHKYRETVLFFPAAGQTCHAYCTYCFRWPQFVGAQNLRFAATDADSLAEYLRRTPEVSDVLITGGDPMVMSSRVLRKFIEPLLADDLGHVTNIRIGTKAISHWPYRFFRDPDADGLLELFDEVAASGRQLALMAHFSHPRELSTAAAGRAIRRVLNTGAVIRCQAPLIRRVNDDPSVWASLWNKQVQMGAVPYYMFMERDTGPRHFFEVPVDRALEIFSEAYAQVSGLARTVRGPVMSTTPGKILVDGLVTIGGTRMFVLKMIQGREPAWVNRVFLSRFDAEAAWLDQLRPASGEREFFFEESIRKLRRGEWQPQWRLDPGAPGDLVCADAG